MRFRKGLVLVSALVIIGLYFWGLGSLPFLDPDEGMNAEISREMLTSGDWIVPRFNGVVYIEKPPLMYWLTAATFAVAGPSEFSARFWKVVSMLGTIALTVGVGRRLFSSRVGGLSGLILATTLGVFLFSRMSQMDPLFVFGLTLAVYGIVSLNAVSEDELPGGISRGGLWLWLGAGIAVMSKGLLGVIFPLALFSLWILLRQDLQLMRRGWSRGGMLLSALLVMPWHAAAGVKVHGFVQFYLWDNQLLRFLGSRGYVEDGDPLGTIHFLGITLVALFPWTPYLMAALAAVWSDARSARRAGVRSLVASGFGPGAVPTAPGESPFAFHDARIHFLVGWLLLVVGFFSASAFKLEYYALPAYPAAALLVAAIIARGNGWGERDRPGTAPFSDRAPVPRGVLTQLRAWSWVALIGGLLYLAAATWAWWAGAFTPLNIVRGLSVWWINYRVLLEQGLPLPSVSPSFYVSILVGGGVLWAVGFAAAWWAQRRDRALATTACVALVGIGLILITSSVLQQIGPHHALKPLAEKLNGWLRPEDIIIHERDLELGGSLPFYTRRHVLVLNGTRGDLEFGSRFPEYRETFIDNRTFLNLWEGNKRVFLITDLPVERSALSQIPGFHGEALVSSGRRWLYANRPPALADHTSDFAFSAQAQ